MTDADRSLTIDATGHPLRSAEPLPFRYRPGLDGIRAIAALLVVLFHAGAPYFTHGYAGVDVFFVLSGFLITSLLIREVVVRHRVDIVAFYARRARRLLPASLVVLLVTAGLYELLATPLDVAQNRGGFIAAALYVSNWYFLGQSQDYFAEESAPSPALHYWSLSVEEQFYIAWPLLLLVLFLVTRRLKIRLRAVVALLALAGLVYSGVLAHGEPMQSYFGTGARAYQLLVGAVVALWVFDRQRKERASPPDKSEGVDPVTRVWGQIAAGAGLALVLTAASPLLGDLSPYGRGAASAIGTALLILGMEYAPARGVASVLSRPTARRLGNYSYTMYLWHWPVIVLGDLTGWLPHAWVPRVIIVVTVTIALSAATWRLVEVPMRRISLGTSRDRKRVAAAGPIAAVLTAGLLVVMLPVTSTVAALLAVTDDEPTAARDATLIESSGSTAPGAPTVLLVGDSHSGFWYEAFAEYAQAQGLRVISVRRAGCAWPDVDLVMPDGTRSPCPDLRTQALEVAAVEKPDLTVLVTRSLFDRPLNTPSGEVSAGDPEWIAAIEQGTEQFMKDLRVVSPHVVILEPIPETNVSMNECLSTGADPASCSLPAIDPPGETTVEAYWRQLAEASGIVTVDLDQLVCPNGVCPAMVDGVPTHRDSQHLTAAYAGSLMPAFEDVLNGLGVDLARGTMTDGTSGAQG